MKKKLQLGILEGLTCAQPHDGLGALNFHAARGTCQVNT